jgi:hypothetical protein
MSQRKSKTSRRARTRFKIKFAKKKKSKVKVKHVGKGLTSKIQIENIDQISNQRFRKYLDYC